MSDEIDDFRLLNELGAGAFARVFLAQQKSMQRLVALKITERKSFESPVLSQLDHPSIVRVFDEQVVGSLTLMYMQYISGGSLRDIVSWRAGKPTSQLSGKRYLDQVAAILREKGESPTQPRGEHRLAHCNWGATVAWIGARLADALHHAHSIGVWHRDIKPENILIASDGRPMLVDFNLSFGQTISGSTIDDAFGGSLGYMSPEQLQVLLGLAATEAVGAASDVYSLAIVLWELLTGRHPFLEEDSSADLLTLTQLIELRKRGPRVDQLPIDCPRGLREMLQLSLSIDPQQRPDSLRLARQCQLSTYKSIDALLQPDEGSWASRWTQRPMRWLVILGLIPNACVSALNIWANERLTIHNFDKAFFDQVEKPVVNLIAYALGIIAAVTIILPIARGLSKEPALTESERSLTAQRCLTMPPLIGLLIFSLWLGSGLAFPLWNRASEHSQVGTIDVVGFVSSQLLHGIIAGMTTFAVAALVALQAFLPRFLSEHADRNGQLELERLNRWLSLGSGALSLTPLLAILALTFGDQFDKSVFVALAIVGFLGHLFTSMLMLKIRQLIALLQTTLAPTHELLQ